MRKSKFLIFFSCELPLIFGIGGKLNKTARDIYKRTPDMEFERVRSIGLCSMIGDGQIDRQTYTHSHTHRRFFLKHIFRLWELCRIKYHKKIEVEFFDDCNTFFTPNVARK